MEYLSRVKDCYAFCNSNEDFKDSRGIQLVPGDIVLCLSLNNGYEYFFCSVTVDSNGRTQISTHRPYVYCFKLDKDKMLSLDDYLNKLGIADKMRVDSYFHIIGRDIYSRIYEKYQKSHNGSVRGMKMVEILGKDLSMGDLVVFRDEINRGNGTHSFKYGIVLSDMKVFTENKVLQRVYFVYKITDFTDTEKELYSSLFMQYQESIVSKNKVLNVGDVYVSQSGKNYYLYLGKINFKAEPFYKSNVLFNAYLDNNKYYWVKFTSEIPRSISNSDENDFKTFLGKNIMYNSSVSYNQEFLSEFFYYNYTSIDELRSFVSELPKGSYFHSHLDILGDIEFRMGREAFSSFKYKIEFL